MIHNPSAYNFTQQPVHVYWRTSAHFNVCLLMFRLCHPTTNNQTEACLTCLKRKHLLCDFEFVFNVRETALWYKLYCDFEAPAGDNRWPQRSKIHADTSREKQSNRCGQTDDFTSYDGLARLVFQCCFTNCYHIITCSTAKLLIDLFLIGVLCKNFSQNPGVCATANFSVVLRHWSTEQKKFSWNVFQPKQRWWPVCLILNHISPSHISVPKPRGAR